MNTFVFEPIPGDRTDGLQKRLSMDTLVGKTVGIIDNSKPNFDHLSDDIKLLLLERYGVKAVVQRKKLMASIPAPKEVMDEMEKDCDLVITGLGD